MKKHVNMLSVLLLLPLPLLASEIQHVLQGLGQLIFIGVAALIIVLIPVFIYLTNRKKSTAIFLFVAGGHHSICRLAADIFQGRRDQRLRTDPAFRGSDKHCRSFGQKTEEMKKAPFCFVLLCIFTFCRPDATQRSGFIPVKQSELKNEKTRNYPFLDCMYKDTYFPKFLVDECKNILLRLCLEIETTKPVNVNDLYRLTHASAESLNDLQDDFMMHQSEIETYARECLAKNFEFIAEAYGYETDIEKMIETREW